MLFVIGASSLYWSLKKTSRTSTREVQKTIFGKRAGFEFEPFAINSMERRPLPPLKAATKTTPTPDPPLLIKKLTDLKLKTSAKYTTREKARQRLQTS